VTLAELKRRNVKVIAGPIDFDEIKCRAIFFEDPWGNIFEVMQRNGRSGLRSGPSRSSSWSAVRIALDYVSRVV